MSLFERTLERAVAERERRAAGKDLISREDLPDEVSPFGILRWYLHPELEEQRTSSPFRCAKRALRFSTSTQVQGSPGW
jgi:hypothetical protein